MKQNSIKLGAHKEQYGSWMSNPVFYMRGMMDRVHQVILGVGVISIWNGFREPVGDPF